MFSEWQRKGKERKKVLMASVSDQTLSMEEIQQNGNMHFTSSCIGTQKEKEKEKRIALIT